ncbi:DUF5348 domain-containing protein [Camelliibacillus cellulosilyticus]|uniref:DUF5348 domain-containing protein n=1 Tax=Camelliibacillus cellulosilyticus TaxID=2174486 RepID=A0ABV9GSR8_9BACL
MTIYQEMIYDDDSDRWIVDFNGRFYGLHCGETFELAIGKTAIPCRIELDSVWYIVLQGIRFNLRKQDTYRIII